MAIFLGEKKESKDFFIYRNFNRYDSGVHDFRHAGCSEIICDCNCHYFINIIYVGIYKEVRDARIKKVGAGFNIL